MKKIIIDVKNNKKQLSNFLTSTFPALNINLIYKVLRKKDIKLNGKRISDNVYLKTGDILEIYIIDDILLGNNINIPIVYEDNNILIVNKPYNLEVVGTYSLTSILKNKYTFLEPCHRIDRNTTGLVLFAKNIESLNILLNKFKNHEIEKHYITLVNGILKNKSKTLNAYLFKDSKKSIVYISDIFKKGYLPITTSYNVLKTNSKNNISLLDITLHTGRTHQIRAHLAHIGYPIIGDGKYGINEINQKFKVKKQLLCSYSLKFDFSTDAKSLNYLNKQLICLPNKPFLDFFN